MMKQDHKASGSKKGFSNKKRWVAGVKTDSTFPPAKTFTGTGEQIARVMARKDVSPKGLGSGVRMIQYFINRAGRNLPPDRIRELEKAKKILQRRMLEEKRSKPPRKPLARK